MISFIMMAKNVEKFIPDAISSLQNAKYKDWELIVIDDHSDDKTYDVALGFAEKDKRIRVYKNKYKGKVMGTNYGYSLSEGDIIKCIDSDDVLLPDFFDFIPEMKNYDAHCHDAYITDDNLNNKYVYRVNPSIIEKDYSLVLQNLTSIPKWSWSFKKEVAEKVFPMPENLPFEDVWMSLTIKRFAKNILHIDKPVYKYRQHSSQTFGGIVNFRKETVIFRAKRILKLIEELKKDKRIMDGFSEDIFEKVKKYSLLSAKENLSFKDIFSSDLPLSMKLRLTLFRKFPFLARYLTILKWKIHSFFS